MRLLIKLILIAVIGFILYHFFGPQIDAMYAKGVDTVKQKIGKDSGETSGTQSATPATPGAQPAEQHQ